MGKRGPKPAGLVELTTTITPELDRALNRMVAVSGLSRSTVVRVALAQQFANVGVLPAADMDALVRMPAPTTRNGVTE